MESLLVPATPAATQEGYEGYAVIGSGSGTVAVVTAATDLLIGVIASGATTSGKSSIALPGSIVPVKLGGTAKKFDRLQIEAAGTWIKNAGTGARVVGAILLEDGVIGDMPAALITNPMYYSA